MAEHTVSICKEPDWPWQWIGSCSCGKQAIRCNTQAAAREFFRRAGCLPWR